MALNNLDCIRYAIHSYLPLTVLLVILFFIIYFYYIVIYFITTVISLPTVFLATNFSPAKLFTGFLTTEILPRACPVLTIALVYVLVSILNSLVICLLFMLKTRNHAIKNEKSEGMYYMP